MSPGRGRSESTEAPPDTTGVDEKNKGRCPKNRRKLKCPDDVDRRTCRPIDGATTHADLRVVELDLARPRSENMNTIATLGECDCAARVAQALPSHLRVGECEREVGRYALLAHTRLDVLVLLAERGPNRVSHELWNKPLAVLAAVCLGVEVADHVHRGRRARVDETEFQSIAHSTHANKVALHSSHRDRVVRKGDRTAVVLLGG